MMALLCTKYGQPSDLVFKNLVPEKLKAHEVRIKTSYVGFNFPDTLLIQGKDQYKPCLPFSPCGELSGVVLETGKDVGHLKPGDKVFAGGMVWGAARSEISLDAAFVYKMPLSMTMEEAAGFCCTYGTALYCLKDRARLKAGETVAVMGAAGGVGTAIIQVAKKMGAKVIACASTKEKIDFCINNGADIGFNYVENDIKEGLKELSSGKGVDVICDVVGSAYSEAAFRALQWDGRFMVLGFTSGQIAKMPMNLPLLKSSSLIGVFWSTFGKKFPDKNRANINKLKEWYDDGLLKVKIDEIIPFDRAIEAFHAVSNRKVKGKILLKF